MMTLWGEYTETGKRWNKKYNEKYFDNFFIVLFVLAKGFSASSFFDI